MYVKVKIDDLTYVPSIKYLILDDTKDEELRTVTIECEGGITVVLTGAIRHKFLKWFSSPYSHAYNMTKLKEDNPESVTIIRG